MHVEEEERPSLGGFTSAKTQYIVDQQKKFGKSYNPSQDALSIPLMSHRLAICEGSHWAGRDDLLRLAVAKSVFRGSNNEKSGGGSGSTLEEMGICVEDLPEKLRSLDEKYIVNILNEIIYNGKKVTWEDIGPFSVIV